MFNYKKETIYVIIITLLILLSGVVYAYLSSNLSLSGNVLVKKHVKPRVPDEYQEVEYLQSTGTQYIDTGYCPSSDTEFTLDYYRASGQLSTYFMGVKDGDVSYSLRMWWDRLNIYFGTETQNPKFTYAGRNTLKFVDKSFYKNDSKVVEFTDTFSRLSKTIYLFAFNDNGVALLFTSYRIHAFQINENDKLERDFVPCYRKVDNEPGLYDAVNKVFYTNAGIGEFTVGPDVSE